MFKIKILLIKYNVPTKYNKQQETLAFPFLFNGAARTNSIKNHFQHTVNSSDQDEHPKLYAKETLKFINYQLENSINVFL